MPEAHEYDLLEYARICLARRRIIYRTVAASIVVALAVAIFTKPVWKSEAKILPTESEMDGGGFSLAAAASRFGLAMPSASSRMSSLYPQILSSHSIVTRVLDREFDSKRAGHAKLYDILKIEGSTPSEREVWGRTKMLDDVLKVDQSIETGVTTMKVFAPESRLAADVAGAFIEELERFLSELRQQEGSRDREFIEARLQEEKEQVAVFEKDLADFRERNKKIDNSPKLLMEQERLLRQLRIQEEVYIELRRQLEIAQIEEVKSAPLVQVLDPPVAPIFRERPRRAMIMVVGAVGGFVLGLVFAFLAEFVGRQAARSPQRVTGLGEALRKDFGHVPGLKRILKA
ncbi:MAG: Wzz/FepE/Etk N-terminal domain-containing protein [bacterium]